MHLPALISDLAIMLLTGGVVTILFKKLNQPLVLGYIVAGFLIGPFMPLFFTVADQTAIETWSEIGIIILMFLLGLEFNLNAVPVEKGSPLAGSSIRESGLRAQYDCMIVGLQRSGLPISQPDVNMRMAPGDLVWCLGSRSMAGKLLKDMELGE